METGLQLFGQDYHPAAEDACTKQLTPRTGGYFALILVRARGRLSAEPNRRGNAFKADEYAI
jgi:hypothetical protein